MGKSVFFSLQKRICFSCFITRNHPADWTDDLNLVRLPFYATHSNLRKNIAMPKLWSRIVTSVGTKHAPWHRKNDTLCCKFWIQQLWEPIRQLPYLQEVTSLSWWVYRQTKNSYPSGNSVLPQGGSSGLKFAQLGQIFPGKATQSYAASFIRDSAHSHTSWARRS